MAHGLGVFLWPLAFGFWSAGKALATYWHGVDGDIGGSCVMFGVWCCCRKPIPGALSYSSSSCGCFAWAPSADPPVASAMRAAAELSAAEDEPQPLPALLAYSDGPVTANGALGSTAAMLRIGSDGAFAIVRLASTDTALSSGRSEFRVRNTRVDRAAAGREKGFSYFILDKTHFIM